MDSDADMTDKITVGEIKVEAVDKYMGKTYVRKLPICYLETYNFLRLFAEDGQRETSSLVFYTEQGILGL